jgi:hypothetical protein
MEYIYIRTNEYWNFYNAVKLGKTISIPDRETTYKTGEIRVGYYVMVICVNVNDKVEALLQKHFKEYQIKYDGGTEFYNKLIVDMIIPFLRDNGIEHRVLSRDEIDGLIRIERVSINDTIKGKVDVDEKVDVDKKVNVNVNVDEKVDVNEKVDINEKVNVDEKVDVDKTVKYIPRDYQTEIINASYNYYKTNDKGLLIIPCGVGKTLISLWISKILNANTILIGVPNVLLLKQWKNTILNVFDNVEQLTVSSGINIKDIIDFLQNNEKKCIIITTYSSAHKIYNVTRDLLFNFDMKINDECHHLTTFNM